MATTIEKKDLDWIERAPCSFSGSATTTASPEAVFAVLADQERWAEWFPGVEKIVVLSPAREGVGLRRLTTVPGGEVEEELIVWDPGKRMALTAATISPRLAHAILDDCRIEPGPSGTQITYTVYLDPVAPMLPIMKLMKGPFSHQLDKAMVALAARAEGR